MKHLIALFLIALCAVSTGARGQNDVNISPTRCPVPAELGAVHLYGLWYAEWEGQTPGATVQWVRHPENPGSVRGVLTRAGVAVQVAGDVDNGEFSLEESVDGQHISATWQGTVLAASCGKEIRGSWNNALDNTSSTFVLRKAPGWQ